MNDPAAPMHPSAPPGKDQKYARPEWERRFLLAKVPPGEVVKTATITDRYLVGTRIRLRQTVEVDAAGSRTIFKLTQKIPAPSGGPGLITTVYLDDAEHDRLAALPAAVLRKTRLSIPPYGIDLFTPPLTGLILAEVEFDSATELHAFTPPPWSLAEVTHDARFTGGRFAVTTASELAPLLAEFGIG